MTGVKPELVSEMGVGGGYPIQVIRAGDTNLRFQVMAPEYTMPVCNVHSAGGSWMVSPNHGSDCSFHDELQDAFDKATEVATKRSVEWKERQDRMGPMKEELDEYVAKIKEQDAG